ncbi:ribonuclease HII [Methanonatronarchaeum sp. AMET6-2]|uniref:ribonuclease HII n=1 Tax=Methanonatronarchaeum sp. AMET6-2 TaxID=2933293 RepID=UPI0012270BC7|nr:ribonuclease HII [Methanonatronarchaeum sp. AMET6-2]RZN61427.1 MAG: ribonuclease HII [Methanonatronarchaeia archaeon]UOY09612.1 ribonuclease HII [Methanonatronarchaeum sp. AMET6-2]
MKVVGVDEAGKGPVIGPMVVSGVTVTQENHNHRETPSQLKNLVLKDSKKIRPEKRVEYAEKIKRLSTSHHTITVSAKQIDELRRVMTMNEIMVKAYSQLLSQMDFDVALLDAADVNEQRFADNVKRELGTDKEVNARHGADDIYPLVSAASILAKVRRDQEIKDIERKTGEVIGTGYPHDKRTIRYIENHLKQKGRLPPETRESWKTATRLEKKHQQKNLSEYHENTDI